MSTERIKNRTRQNLLFSNTIFWISVSYKVAPCVFMLWVNPGRCFSSNLKMLNNTFISMLQVVVLRDVPQLMNLFILTTSVLSNVWIF